MGKSYLSIFNFKNQGNVLNLGNSFISINNLKEAERLGFSLVMLNYKIECMKVLTKCFERVIPLLFIPFFLSLLIVLFHIYF
jgi:hypothetical protein